MTVPFALLRAQNQINGHNYVRMSGGPAEGLLPARVLNKFEFIQTFALPRVTY